MPESRPVALLDRLNWRSNTGRAVVTVVAGALIITSYVLPAAINTSLCTRGTPGKRLPSSAISEKPAGGTVAGATAIPVCDPTIEGTCMRKPALTKRTKTFPVIPVVTGVTTPVVLVVVPAMARNNEGLMVAVLALLNATPLKRYYN